MSRRYSGFSLAQRAQLRILALLLVGALLLCHGVFGALHLCTTPPAGSSAQHAVHDHSSPGGATSSHDHQVCHLMHAGNYYAVLLTALLGLALGLLLLLKGVRLWSRITLPPAAFQRFRPALLHPPPVLTVSPLLLQVMRL
jgi:hypothetical protein